MALRLHVLCLDDHPIQALLNEVELGSRLPAGSFAVVRAPADALAHVQGADGVAALLTDWHFGHAGTAEAVVSAFRSAVPDGACIVYSTDPDARSDALSAGADRFYVKDAVSLSALVDELLGADDPRAKLAFAG